MRWWLAGVLIACTGGTAVRPGTGTPGGLETHAALADDDVFTPSYGKPELEKTLIAERAAEATLEHRVTDLEAQQDDDALRVASADLAVRRRFIASLEACQRVNRACPPRLDDPAWTFDPDSERPEPPITAAPRFDAMGWRAISDELFGRACACRTLGCVDSVGVAIDVLETRPSHDVAGDEAASLSITRARECLFRLRGKSALRVTYDKE